MVGGQSVADGFKYGVVFLFLFLIFVHIVGDRHHNDDTCDCQIQKDKNHIQRHIAINNIRSLGKSDIIAVVAMEQVIEGDAVYFRMEAVCGSKIADRIHTDIRKRFSDMRKAG